MAPLCQMPTCDLFLVEKEQTANPINKEIRCHLTVEKSLMGCEQSAAVISCNPIFAQVATS